MAPSVSGCILILILISSLINLIASTNTNTGDIKLIRGVELKLQSFYSPSQDFTCLDGAKTIPFSSVNDDYCDCGDGTDEPGTSACPEGKYYCYNIGYKAKYLQSSRVNDGICDCCDGSDEYDSAVVCFNECQKFGQEEQELKKEEMAESIEGSKIKDEYILSGKEIKEQKKARVETINGLLMERMKELEESRATKESAEAPEKEAKERHQRERDEIQNKLKDEQDAVEREAAFELLDTDQDGWISMAELLSHNHMESDMSENEVKDMLGGEIMIDREGLVNAWKSIKPKFRKFGRPDPSTFDESDRDDVTLPEPDEKDNKEDGKKEGEFMDDIALKSESPAKISKRINDAKKEMKKIYENKDDEDDEREDYKSAENYLPESDEDEDDDDDDDEEEDKGNPEEDDKEDTKGKVERPPDYDEATKQLIETADKARSHFDTIDKTVKDLESEKKDLEEYLEIDFGGHEEFSALKGECYEYTDREYVYKLCPFDRVSQRNKDGGGSETDLGNKMSWKGKEEDRFSVMKYEGGQTCWNGPARSTTVRLSCGKENVITSVGEPSRCEYEMTFKTPAMCDNGTKHDEL